MNITSATIRGALLAALFAGGVTLSGVPGASAALPTSPVMPKAPLMPVGPSPCSAPGGAGPGYNASIGNRQNGATVCVVVGEKLLVLLSVSPSSEPHWGRVHVSPTGILTSAPMTLMLSPGLTGTNFLAAHAGVVELTAHRSACTGPQNGSSTCASLVSWKSTVIVRTLHKLPE